MSHSPVVVILGGPNGAGKSTAAARFLPPAMAFLHADEIAKGLPSYPSSRADLDAGRILIEEMELLERERADFAVETNLASRSLAARAARLRASGYLFRLIFIWSPDVEFSIARVAARVRSGGHAIPEETIRRRYSAGVRNFFQIYQPLADIWEVHDNIEVDGFRLIADGEMGGAESIHLTEVWQAFWEAGHEQC